MPPELLAPAGSPEAAAAAFAAGADAVYAGMREFSARAEAGNFDEAELSSLVAHARSLRPARKVYVALNTVVREGERAALVRTLSALERIGPDALIVQDPGVARIARRHFPSLTLHASTQMAVHSAEGVRAMADAGFSRVVLARECTIAEIAATVACGAAEIEVFVHGALCYSHSGLCLYSAMERGRSGNRGRCAYGCREGRDGAFPFSMRDLALAPVLGRLVATGVASLKIEGRMKSPLWVACVTEWYRGILDGTLSPEREKQLCDDVRSVFAREWTTLYACGETPPPEGVVDPRSLGHRGTPAGTAAGVSPPDRSGTRWMRMRTALAFERHDGLQLKIPSYMAANDGHPWGFAVGRLRLPSGREVFSVGAGETVDVALPRSGVPDIPPGQEVMLAASQAVARRHPCPPPPRTVALEGRPAKFEVELGADAVRVRASDAAAQDVGASVVVSGPFEAARVPGRTAAAARDAFAKLGGTEWRVADPGRDVGIRETSPVFVPVSSLNAARRAAVEALSEAAERHRAAVAAAALSDPLPEPAKGPGGVPPAVPALTVKWGLEQTPDPVRAASADRTVLALRHVFAADAAALADRLAAWREALGAGRRPALALPVIARDRDAAALDAALDSMLSEGFTDWEAADWAGARRLRERGVSGWTADFTLPAANRDAVAALCELGAARCVISPETPEETARELAEATGTRVERLVRQHVPLFISSTEPCGGGSGAIRRFGGTPPLVSRKIDGCWVTVSERLWTAPPVPGVPSREDYSFDPPS